MSKHARPAATVRDRRTISIGMCEPDSLSLLGTPVDVFASADDLIALARQRIRARRRTFCVAINPEKVYRAKSNAALRQILSSADIRICDGVGVSLACLIVHRKRLHRCTGVDMFFRLLNLSVQEGWKVFLLGASPQVNEAARRALERRFPGLAIAGNRHGYFEHSDEIVESVNSSGADLLFVAMGSPRQEFWIGEHMPRLRATFCMGVGGSLDILSGAIRRAPAMFRKTGTEWLYRLLSEPRRIRRQLVLPLFVLDVLRASVRS